MTVKDLLEKTVFINVESDHGLINPDDLWPNHYPSGKGYPEVYYLISAKGCMNAGTNHHDEHKDEGCNILGLHSILPF